MRPGGDMTDGSVQTVLYLVDGLGLSGKTKSMVELACGLDPARYRPVVCTFDAEESPLSARLRERGVPMHSLKAADGLSVGAVWGLMLRMRELRPDVVHCYNPRPMLYGGIAARLLGMRRTIGSLSAFACMVPDRVYAFLPQKLATRSWKNRLRNRAAAKLMRKLVTVSPTLGENFCRYNKIPLEKLTVVPYAISLDAAWKYGDEAVAAFRREIGAAAGDVVLASVGRLVEQKDYPTQFRAFAAAANQAPQLRMVLAGDGPLRPELEALAKELGVADRVHFLGHCERVPLVLRSADVFVMTSKFEPYGVALLEAKAAGLPVAATAVNEVPEIVPDGRCGLLVPSGDVEKLAAVFVRLAVGAELRRRLGQESLREARERHDLRKTLMQYQDLYDRTRAANGRTVGPTVNGERSTGYQPVA